MNDDSQSTSIRETGGLVGEALAHVSSLVRKEVDLARAEISENLNRAGVAIGMIVAAVVFALVALNVLAAALVGAITEAGVPATWSAVIVGVTLLIVGYVLMSKGSSDLKLNSLAPTRAVKNVQRDAEAVNKATRHGN